MANRGRSSGSGWAGKRQQGQGRVRSSHTGSGGYGRRLHTGRVAKPMDAERNQRDYYKMSAAQQKQFKREKRAQNNAFDEMYGFELFEQGEPRIGWLLNMLPVAVESRSGDEVAGLELFFLQQDGSTFKSIVYYQPYFYIYVVENYLKEAKQALERRFEGVVHHIDRVEKVDLDMNNHLSGKSRSCLKVCFENVANLLKFRREITPIVKKNQTKAKAVEAYGDLVDDPMEKLMEMREYDVPYYVRVSIDKDINVGSWYEVAPSMTESSTLKGVTVTKQDIVEKAEPRVLAFDIECTKQPLKFPVAETDQIFMISYMADGEGFLIINREIVSEDIDDFEYNPKPEFPGPFQIFNEANERDTIIRFFEHVRELRPNIFVTYNGDYFDWPFMEKRAEIHGLDMGTQIGICDENKSGEYRGRCAVHMDCLYWVKRDSYLPAGSRGLKAVTKAKLGYDPVEVDPENMVRYAQEQPQHMAAYSVSDAVATYYLYDKYINLFVFSLCTIIPLGSEDVLRKGSGTLCEMLLMVKAFTKNIVCPNKQMDASEQFHEGHLLSAQTYVGGHVECLESGVFRNDIPCKFRLTPDAFQGLIDNIDRDLTFALEVEGGVKRRTVENYDQVRSTIIHELELLRDTPLREEEPTIYHLDVAAMYPNIILTNRLQPCAIVDESVCASCDFNNDESNCKRDLDWVWRGDYFPTSRAQYESLKKQVQYEPVDGKPFNTLKPSDQEARIRKRVKDYCQNVYSKSKVTQEVTKTATICQRENPFYVDTVKAFRDRRYDYKLLTKKWAKKRAAAEKQNDVLAHEESSTKVLLYDSLQLAHKCILNSFYGYVMRKGARWHSMEMAGVVTHTGGNIIKQARRLVERIGRPLELDTDGIWCILPGSFPENYTFKLKGGGSFNISYPCVMLNADVHANYTNHQYQNLTEPETLQYETHSECSIYFEVDGPYRCMVLPASQEEGKLLKKRYAVFNFDGSLAELKGFELKRRGELKIIKIFQSQVFEKFLEGSSLQECYAAVAEIANFWMDVLFTKGANLTDQEVIELISENRSMSRTLAEYGNQKSTSISTAKRLAQFLGEDMVKDKGLACKLLIAAKPYGAPTTERAIPTAIFQAEASVRDTYLRRWLKDNSITNFGIRSIIDWDYYIERLGGAVRKIITIPAALQKIANPVPRVPHPDWLGKLVREKHDPFKQKKLTDMFSAKPAIMDLEDFGGKQSPTKGRGQAVVRKHIEGKRVSMKAPPAPEPMEVENKEEEEKALEPVPRLEDDLKTWHLRRKEEWRKRRALKKAGGSELVVKGRPRIGRRGGLQSYMRNSQERMLAASHWQVLEFRPEEGEPGYFRVFFMSAKSELHNVLIKLPRTFFVNKAIEGQDFNPPPSGVIEQRQTRLLPRSHKVENLMQVEVEESVFLRNGKDLTNYLTHPAVHGVYESQVSLETRLISNLGCVMQVKPEIVRGIIKSGNAAGSHRHPFTPKELNRLTTSNKYGYLDASSASYRRIYLYQAGVHDRKLFALFFVEDSSELLEQDMEAYMASADTSPVPEDSSLVPHASSCQLFFMTGSGELPSKGRLRRNWSEILMAKHLNSTNHAVEFKQPQRFRNADSCWQAISQSIERYAGSGGPTVVLLQSSVGKVNVLEKVNALRQLPVISMTAHEQDNELPALQWHEFLVHRAMDRFQMHGWWWMNRVDCARYGHIPIAHVGEDYAMTMADTFFHRMLEYNRIVLWSSPSGKPDLGGSSHDMTHLSVVEDHELPSVASPGVYRGICIELDISHLAVCTMIEAERITEIECGDGALLFEEVVTGGDNAQASIGSATECIRAFKVLKAMVENWWNDLRRAGNVYADKLLVHFYRWLCSPKSRLHDPALHRFVYQMMQKVFYQLLAEVRRLGGEIVFANFQRMVIHTQKRDKDVAVAYYDHLLRTIRSKPLFQMIELRARRFWSHFVFMDESNLGGFVINMNKKETGAEKSDNAMEVDEKSQALEGQSGRMEVEQHPGIAEVEEQTEITDVEQQAKDREGEQESSENRPVDGNTLPNTDPTEDVENNKVEEADGGEIPSKRKLRPRDADGSLITATKGKRMKTLDDEDSDDEGTYFDARAYYENDNDSYEDVSEDEEGNRGDGFYKKKLKESHHHTATNEQVDENPLDMVWDWNICDYLPESLQEEFHIMVGKFILKPLEFAAKYHLQVLSDLEGAERPVDGPVDLELAIHSNPRVEGKASHNLFDTEEFRKAEHEYIVQLMESYFARELLRIVSSIDASSITESSFPVHAGSHLQLHRPALEFVKHICAVFELDSTIQDAVIVLKRQLLRMLHVREFSPEAKFENPSLSLILQDTICNFCNYCMDLDLCKNPASQLEMSPTHEVHSSSWNFTCPECTSLFEKDAIEFTLVQKVQQRVLAYQLQDLVCKKCNQVKVDNMDEYCTCSGAWKCVLSQDEIEKWLLPYLNVAKYHDFEWLQEVVTELLPN